MPDPLDDVNEVLKDLESVTLRTTQGAFVKVEDLKKYLEKRQKSRQEQDDAGPPPKTFTEAKARVKKDSDIMKNFPPQKPSIGRSVPAVEPQPSSRT